MEIIADATLQERRILSDPPDYFFVCLLHAQVYKFPVSSKQTGCRVQYSRDPRLFAPHGPNSYARDRIFERTVIDTSPYKSCHSLEPLHSTTV